MAARLQGDFRKAAQFYGLVLALAIAVSLLAPLIGEASLLVTMFTPAIGVVFMLTVIAPESGLRAALRSLGLDTAGWKAWPLAVALPVCVMAAAYAAVWASDIASYKAPEVARPAVQTAVKLMLGLVISTVWALSEEVGWRGYLMPRLHGLGVAPAMLLAGFLNGVWHVPLMVATPYYHAVGAVGVTVPLFLITLTLAGVIYGYLRLWSGSVWPAAVAHGVVNWTWSLMENVTAVHNPVLYAYVGGESGIALIAVLSVAALILLCRRRAQATG